MQSKRWWGSLVLILFCFTLDPALGRDLQGRVGLGYNSQFANTTYLPSYRVPGISVKYAFNREFAVAGIVGAATTSPLNSVAGLKIFKNIFYETNLNFYFLLGGGLINANGTTGVQLITGVGVEFFIPGVESLGLSLETGASYDNGSGRYALRTMGLSFLDAGIHFYF